MGTGVDRVEAGNRRERERENELKAERLAMST